MPESLKTSVRDAAIKIAEMSTTDEILAYMAGDDRITVLRAANERLKEIKHPGILSAGEKLLPEFHAMWLAAGAGEEFMKEQSASEPPKPDEKPADTQKDGATGRMTQNVPGFAAGVSGQKSPSAPKAHITGEDVVKALRDKGVDI